VSSDPRRSEARRVPRDVEPSTLKDLLESPPEPVEGGQLGLERRAPLLLRAQGVEEATQVRSAGDGLTKAR
jgi:hypothetical protein